MTLYSTGTVAVTNGSTTVTGTLTDWSAALLTAGARFDLAGMSYPIVAVVSDTELTIGLPYAGATASGLSYAISRVEALPQQTALNAATIAQLLRGMPAHTILGKALAQAADEADGRQLLGIGADAMSFEFDGGSTTMADPTAGYFRVNNATAASATALAISATDQDGNDLSDFFLSRLSSTSTPKAHLAITYGAERIEFAVTAVTDNGSWLQLTVQDGIDTDALADTDMGAFTFWSAGNKGDDGSTPEEVAALLEPLLLAEGLPTRLGTESVQVTDANSIVANGWYRCTAGASNIPIAQASYIFHHEWNSSAAIQYWQQFNNQSTYSRRKVAGAWGAWAATRPYANDQDATFVNVASTQTVSGAKTFSALATLLEGVSFGNQTAANPNVLTDHIALFNTNFGFNVSASRLNYNAGSGAQHDFYINSVLKLEIGASVFRYGGNTILTTANGMDLTSAQTVGGAKTFSGSIASASSITSTAGTIVSSAPNATSYAHYWLYDHLGAPQGLLYWNYANGSIALRNATTSGNVELSITDAGLLNFKGIEVRDKSNTPDGSLALAGAGTDTVVRPWSAAHLDGVRKFRSYTVGTVPSASAKGAGYSIYVSNETGGAIPAFSDGTSWRRCTDRAVIS